MTLESLTRQDHRRASLFAWLERLILAPRDSSEELGQPMTNYEFYAMSALILIAYVSFALFLGPTPG